MEQYVATPDARAPAQDQPDGQHILLVSRDPALRAFVRLILADARYIVTATSTLPRTFATSAAARPALLIIDLALTERAGWDLLIRLHAQARTARLPVIITAHDPRLLAHAARYPYLYGGQVRLAISLAVDTLRDAVRSVIDAA